MIYQIAPKSLNVPDHHVMAWYFGACEKRTADFVGTRWQLRNHVMKCNGFDHVKTQQDMLRFVPKQCTVERCQTARLLCPVEKVLTAIDAVKRKTEIKFRKHPKPAATPQEQAVQKLQAEFQAWLKGKQNDRAQLQCKTA